MRSNTSEENALNKLQLSNEKVSEPMNAGALLKHRFGVLVNLFKSNCLLCRDVFRTMPNL